MTRTFILIAAAVAAAAVLVPATLASKSGAPTVAVQQSKLGRILVDGRGRTLYLFERDRRGKSQCYGACATDWPPLLASGNLRAGTGAKASLLGRTKRRDGRMQVTYHGHPLYRFFEDTRKGQTSGEGLDFFGGEWYVVSPAGAKVEEHGKTSSGSAGGYGGGW